MRHLAFIAIFGGAFITMPVVAQQSDVHCTTPDASGHMVSIWTTAADCQKRIKQAQTAANSMPPRAVKPVRMDTLAADAIRKYCATAAALACSLYVGKVSKCPPLAAQGYSILVYERIMKQHGATPHQAAELAVRSAERSLTQLNPDDLDFIAEAATSVPDTEPPEQFQEILLKQCIDVAAE